MYDPQGAAALPETEHPAVDASEPTAGTTMTAVADDPDPAADQTSADDTAPIEPDLDARRRPKPPSTEAADDTAETPSRPLERPTRSPPTA